MGLIRTLFGSPPGADARAAREGSGAASEADAIAEAVRLASSGRYDQALRAIAQADRGASTRGDARLIRGSILFECGRSWEARTELVAAAEAGIRKSAMYAQLGWIDLRAGRLALAEKWMREAIAVDPQDWQLAFGLASVLQAQGNHVDAAACLARTLELSPGNVNAFAGLVTSSIARRDLAGAEVHARRGLAENPESVAALGCLGIVLIWQDRFREANEVFERAHALAAAGGGGAPVLLDAGIPLRDGGRVDEAVAFYRRYLPAHPAPNAHAHYAFALLKAGNLAEGFEQNEFRWMIEPLRSLRARHPKPAWNGQDVRGRTVLVIGEQGIGDVIQFIRYAALVKARGATILVLLRKPMRELIEDMACVDAVLDLGDALPDFDFFVHVMSLPRVFGTTLATVPSRVPYLPVKADRVETWRRRLHADGTLKVGLVWAGDPVGARNPYKSVPLAMLSPLARVPNVRFYSLQKGNAAADVASAPAGLRLVDLAADIHDFADTAAIVESLDLVISVCTAVAHLAGARGRPVWTLLSRPADWRWLERGEATPWYPTMRLFRQREQGDWAGVIDQVARALEERARDRGAAPIAAGERSRGPEDDRGAAQQAAVASPSPGSGDDAAPHDLCRVREARYGILQFRPDGSVAARSIQAYGEYLQPQLDALTPLIGPGSIVVEVASGFGAHALFLSSAVGESGHVFACESRPALHPLLRNNLEANRVVNVTAITAPLRGGSAEHASAREFPAATAPDRGPDGNEATIDALQLPRFQWLKINDGADAREIIAGAAASLWRYRPNLFVASAAVDAIDDLERLVGDFGYHCRRIETPLLEPRRLERAPGDIFAGKSVQALLAIPEEVFGLP